MGTELNPQESTVTPLIHSRATMGRLERDCPECAGRGYTLHVRSAPGTPEYLLQVCAVCHPLLGAA